MPGVLENQLGEVGSGFYYRALESGGLGPVESRVSQLSPSEIKEQWELAGKDPLSRAASLLLCRTVPDISLPEETMKQLRKLSSLTFGEARAMITTPEAAELVIQTLKSLTPNQAGTVEVLAGLLAKADESIDAPTSKVATKVGQTLLDPDLKSKYSEELVRQIKGANIVPAARGLEIVGFKTMDGFETEVANVAALII